jgi:hypothetical protein
MLDYDHLHTLVSALRKKQIFFVGGTVRSGTTWLQLLLDAHPLVSCSGEGHFTDVLWMRLKQALEQHDSIIKKHNENVFNGVEIYRSLRHEDVTLFLPFVSQFS